MKDDLRKRIRELEDQIRILEAQGTVPGHKEVPFLEICQESPVSIVTFDKNGRITFVNRWHLEVFARSRYDLEHFLGRDVGQLEGLRSSGVASRVKEILEGRSFAAEDVHVERFSGGHSGYVNIRGNPILKDGGVAGGVLIQEDVTARKTAEMALAKSEAKFRALTESTASGIFIIQDDHVTYMNPAGLDLLGWSLEELAGMPFWDLFLPEHKEIVREQARRRLEGKTGPGRYELKLLTRQGAVRWIDLAVNDLEHQGRPAILGTARDITQDKENRQALVESRRRLEEILDFLPDPTLALDRAGTVVVWNRAMEELTGIQATDILGKGNHEHALPFYRERRPILADLAMDWDEKVKERYPFVTKTGNTLLTEIFIPHMRPGGAHLWGKARALVDSHGQVTGSIETIRDVSSRVEMEKAQRAAVLRYKALVQSLPVGVITLDPDYMITEINAMGEELLKLDREEAVKLHCFDILHSGACETGCPIKSARESGRSVGPLETTVVNRAGERLNIRLSAALLLDDNGQVAGGVEVFQDITAMKALERERANIISMFAHDMKSPLVGIQGFALRLMRDQDSCLDDSRRKYLEIIRREAGSLENIINDFLDFSRLETGGIKLNKSATDLDKEFLELVETFQPRFEQAGIILKVDGWRKLPVIDADAAHLRRAFTNLLENALKYSDAPSTVSLTAGETAREIMVRVEDQGVGIPAEDLPHIFDVFYRGRGQRKRQGHGLGLAGVEAIIKGHGGRVVVTSEVGKGSVFTVFLPKNGNGEKEPE